MGLERHPGRRVEVRIFVFFFYFLIIFCFLVITPCNCFSEFKLSRQLCELSRRFLESRATLGAYISPSEPGEPCALVSSSASN
jgi:hypothetical protein